VSKIIQKVEAGLSTSYAKSRCWAVESKLRRLAWRLNAKKHLARRPAGLVGESQTYQRFLVLAHARSGSNLLVDAIGSDPRILSFPEIFHRTETFVHPLEATAPLRYLKKEMPLRFLREAVYGGFDPLIRAVGFKIFPEHLEAGEQMREVREWLARQTDISVVNLTRRNLLRYYVSLKRAWMTGEWKSVAGKAGGSAHPAKLHLDPEDAERIFTLREERDASCRCLFADHPILNLHYEDLQQQLQPTFNRVQQFLGLEPQPVKVGLHKQETRALPEIIENYDELRRRWTGTRWETFLDD
jgi:LPS sulfotransferase NodH